ncbi:hypothetical protein D3C76_719400 [compost metagenome]
MNGNFPWRLPAMQQRHTQVEHKVGNCGCSVKLIPALKGIQVVLQGGEQLHQPRYGGHRPTDR